MGNVAKSLGFDVISLDLCNADICTDVLVWQYEKLPVGHFDCIWCSPPCETFSNMKCLNIGRNGHTKESVYQEMVDYGIPILEKTEEIIRYFKPAYWFLENPYTGKMKEHISTPMSSCYIVDYCKYCNWGYRKRTAIWYGQPVPGFEPQLCKKDCENIVDGKHRIRACGAKMELGQYCKGQGGGSDKKPKYRIPPALIHQLLSPLIVKDAEVCLYKDSR